MRFMALSERTLQGLRGALPETDLQLREHEAGTTVVFKLSETVDYEPLCRFLDESDIDPSQYSVWVSVVTASDHSGVSVPDHVLRLIRRTKGGLDFSFVSLGPDDSEVPEAHDSRASPAAPKVQATADRRI